MLPGPVDSTGAELEHFFVFGLFLRLLRLWMGEAGWREKRAAQRD